MRTELSNIKNEDKLCVAVIGDIVGSRDLGPRRYDAQENLLQVMRHFNDKYKKVILAKFIITTGDEFQALLTGATVIHDLIWQLENVFKYGELRLGIGLGTLSTPLNQFAIGMDGTTWHNARSAIVEAKKETRLGGVFSGFSTDNDLILNGFARLLYYHRKDFTDRQREVVALLRGGFTQSEIARKLSITRQAANHHAQSSGWQVYREGETAWETMLKEFDYSQRWSHEQMASMDITTAN